MFFDHFGFTHVLDHFTVGSDEASLLDPNAVDVLLMLSGRI
jgi:hypothetical protein